jgi:hypothetical protein
MFTYYFCFEDERFGKSHVFCFLYLRSIESFGAATGLAILVVMMLDEHGDFLLDEYWDVNGLWYRDVNRVGLRDVYAMRDQVRYLHWHLYSIWNFFFDCDGNFLFNHNWIWFGDVHKDRHFLFDMDRDVYFDGDRDFLLYSVRDWLWDRYFYFLCDRNGLDILFFVVTLAASEGVSFLKPAQAEMAISPERMSRIT